MKVDIANFLIKEGGLDPIRIFEVSLITIVLGSDSTVLTDNLFCLGTIEWTKQLAHYLPIKQLECYGVFIGSSQSSRRLTYT